MLGYYVCARPLGVWGRVLKCVRAVQSCPSLRYGPCFIFFILLSDKSSAMTRTALNLNLNLNLILIRNVKIRYVTVAPEVPNGYSFGRLGVH